MKSNLTIAIIIIFNNYAFCLSNQNQAVKAFVKDSDVFVAYTDGSQKQLTFNGSDRDPILIPKANSVVYIRETLAFSGRKSYTKKKIMKVDINTLIETILSDQKPYKDGLDNTYEILSVFDPTLSLDQKFLIFGTEKYVTGSQIVKVDLESGKWIELFSAESFELIKTGQYKGCFFIGQSEVGYSGRGIYYKLCTQSGEVLKEFEDKNSLMQFRGNIK